MGKRWFIANGRPVSESYHSGGSLLIRAKDADDALAKAIEHAQSLDTSYTDERLAAGVFVVRPLAGLGDLIVFPDAGCC